jgi:hypothetical protein
MVGDILRHAIAGGIILGIGLLLGYRPEAGVPGVLAGFGLLFAAGFGIGWVFLVIGLLVRTPMTVMTFGFTFIFPLVFASNISVDPATMPGWLEAFVNVNPVSHMTTALRGLFAGTGGPRPPRAGRHHAGARPGGVDALPPRLGGEGRPGDLWDHAQLRAREQVALLQRHPHGEELAHLARGLHPLAHGGDAELPAGAQDACHDRRRLALGSIPSTSARSSLMRSG